MLNQCTVSKNVLNLSNVCPKRAKLVQMNLFCNFLQEYKVLIHTCNTTRSFIFPSDVNIWVTPKKERGKK